jgi:hypothetical protein
MILGKRFSRIKRSVNAADINVSFTRKDGTEMPKFHRKLNMMLVLLFGRQSKVNKKALMRELEKYQSKLPKEK